MQLSNLVKITERSKKRLGRGYGSGKAKTSGRGTKGQGSRETIKAGFEGGQLPLIKRLPIRKGRDRFKPLGKKPIVLNLKSLNLLPEKSIIDLEFLIKKGLVREDEARELGVKILGDGEIIKPLTIKLACSHGAEEKIKKAGGKVENTRIQTNQKRI